MMERKTITVPEGLCDRAHSHGLNVSKVCAIALAEKVEKIENTEGRSHTLPKQNSEPSTAGTVEANSI